MRYRLIVPGSITVTELTENEAKAIDICIQYVWNTSRFRAKEIKENEKIKKLIDVPKLLLAISMKEQLEN